MERIRLAPGAEEVPLALMLSELLGVNLDKPEKLKAFNTLETKAYILAKDVGTDVTMVFNRGSLTFYEGKPLRPDLSIETDSAILLDLANINIRFGMPYYFDEIGREFLKKLARRDLRIKGMFAHPIALTKLTKIMSIN